MSLILFLDCESTGLDPVVHAPWEVAWQLADHDPTEGTLTMLGSRVLQVTLTPHEMAAADPVSLQIGRYVERRGAGIIVPPAEAQGLLRSDLRIAGATKPTDVTLVGAVPSFDDAMLGRWWGGPNNRPWHYHLVDIETLMAGALARSLPALAAPPFDYSTLLAEFGIVENETMKHTAEGDVFTLIDAYCAVYGLT